ncbi:MAG: nucleotidyl transferase AbiEii/AbiGii toxin family protein [bacterium]
MNDILTINIKNLIIDLKSKGYRGEVIINAVKEHLQYYVLNFIYNNRKYSSLVMYGGTLLRICYGLDRMSEDLDFQTSEKIDFEELSNSIIKYFESEFGYNNLQISINEREGNDTDLLKLNFNEILKGLETGVPWTTLKLRFDVNLFPTMPKFEQELIPVTKDNYTFSIRTYPISTMMASKVAAVMLRIKRNNRGVDATYKGRDIYDIIWYMKKKIIPNLEYLKEKGLNFENPIELFDRVTQRVLNIDDAALKVDLNPLFYNTNDLDIWFKNWRNIFANARNSYELYTVTDLVEVNFTIDFDNKVHNFYFYFNTEEDKKVQVRFSFRLSENFFVFKDIAIDANYRKSEVDAKIIVGEKTELSALDYEYAGLFYEKIQDYLTRNRNIITLKNIETKLIRSTADKFDPKTQVIQDKRLIIRSKLEDLI